MRNHLTLRICLAALIGLAAACPAPAQDTITLKQTTRRGSKILGTIKEVSPRAILVSTGGNDRSISANEIQRISLAGEPTGLRQGRAAIFSGQYEQARESLDAVALNTNAREVMRQEVEFYRANALANLALRGSVEPVDAASSLLNFVKRHRNSFHFYEAVEQLGSLAVMVGSYDRAARYFQQLAKAPWPDYVLRSQVLQAHTLRSQGKFVEAIQKYDQALSSNETEPNAERQKTLARIGRAACLAEQGKTQEALDVLSEIITRNDATDAEVFAQAYLAQGAAFRQADRAVDAVLAYLHVDLLYFGQRDAHAEALFYLSQLWPEINSPDRGVQARSLLKSRYAKSGWAKRA